MCGCISVYNPCEYFRPYVINYYCIYMFYYCIYIFIIVYYGRIAPHREVIIKCMHVCMCMYHCTWTIIIISDVLTNFSQVEIQLPKYLLLKHRSVSNVVYVVREIVFLVAAFSVMKLQLITALIIILR